MEIAVLAAEFGLFDGKRHTEKVVARTLGITEEQAYNHKIHAFRTLRHPTRIKNLFTEDYEIIFKKELYRRLHSRKAK